MFGYIADGVNAGDVGVLIGIGRDRTVRICRHSRRRQIERVGIGVAADGPQQRIHFQGIPAPVAMQAEHALGQTRHRADLGARQHMDAVLAQSLHQLLAQHGVERP